MHVISVIYGEETDVVGFADSGRPTANATVKVRERKCRSTEKGHLGHEE